MKNFLLFLAVLILACTFVGCIERRPEQVVKRQSPVTGQLQAAFEEYIQMTSDSSTPLEVRARAGRKYQDMIYHLLTQGLIIDGRDLYYAAAILQDSTALPSADNRLLAYHLAGEAARKEYPEARHLAAVSLDRYLLARGIPQHFGTQLVIDSSGHFDLAPFDSVTTDSMRAEWDVPSLDSMKSHISALNRLTSER